MNEELRLSHFHVITPEKLEELKGMVGKVFSKIDEVASPAEGGGVLVSTEIHDELVSAKDVGKVIDVEKYEKERYIIFIVDFGGTIVRRKYSLEDGKWSIENLK